MTGKWIEVFKIGKQTDSAGNERDWTETDLDTIAANYNGQTEHEAPVVVGHPKDNSPAFGWVEGLKREGKMLYARLKDVTPEFADLVKQGIYKKRSISLYPDLTLRHIGFLGGMPPAVKGLADIAFKEQGQAMTYEFADYRISSVGRIMQRVRDFLIDKFDIDTADRVVSPWEIEGLMTPPSEDIPLSPMFQEKEVQDMDKLKELQDQLTAKDAELKQFSECNETLTAENNKLKSRLAEGEKSARGKEYAAFCDSLPTRITPVQRPAVIAHMDTLHGLAEIDFAEADGTMVKKTPLAVYKENLQNLPEVVSFQEKATKDKAGEKTDTTDALEISKKAVEFQESETAAGRTISITEAVNHVTKGGK